MNEFIKTLLSLSLSGTLLLLLVLLPRRLYRERFSRRWQYYIWLVVALRFLLPFAPGVTFSGYLFDRIGENSIVSDAVGYSDYGAMDTDASSMDNDTMNYNRPDAYGSKESFYKTSPDDTPVSASSSVSLSHFCTGIFFLWLITAIALLVRKATAYRSFLSFLQAASTQVSDVEILNLLSDCAEQLHIRGRIELYTNPLIASPILAGFFRPKILLPSCESSGQQRPVPVLRYIFTHELVHHRRRDMLYKWFIQLILCVHWFNPFVYLLARETGRACELACDETVTAGLDNTEKKVYGNTLLAFLQTDNTYKNPLVSITLTKGAKELKERLGAIMKSPKKTKAMTLLTVLATAAVCAAFCTLGAYAKSEPTVQHINDSGSTKSSEKDSSRSDVYCEYDSGVYYIYTDGTDRDDRPLVGFTDGYLGIVLISKDGSTCLGPFAPTADTDDFLEEITQICNDMVDSKHLTSEDVGIILMSVKESNLQRLPAADNSSGSRKDTEGSETIVCECPDILLYENGSPYLHGIFVNHTSQMITELEYCMLAYDADGHPLKLHWNFMDSSAEASYDTLVHRTGLHLYPGQTTVDFPGGWSLKDEDTAQIDSVIICLKRAVFEDGTAWSNPGYEDWQEAYLGKEARTEELQGYYPQEYATVEQGIE